MSIVITIALCEQSLLVNFAGGEGGGEELVFVITNVACTFFAVFLISLRLTRLSSSEASDGFRNSVNEIY